VSSFTKTICIVTGNHLCHNPRVVKSATALANRGYAVEVVGAWLDPMLKARDLAMLPGMPFKFAAAFDATTSTMAWVMRRTRKKVGRLIRSTTGPQNMWELGYVYPELRREAFRRDADLFISHSEQAIAVAVDLLRSGRRAGVDMEDWFSEDLLPEARRERPVSLLRDLEREILTAGAYASCPSRAMSRALMHEYGSQRASVIYNAFEWNERLSLDGEQRDRKNRGLPSIHWYSQTLGPGRGLEDLLAALPLLDREVEIHLRGELSAGFERWIENCLSGPLRDWVFLHPLVPNCELLSRIAEHDIGFAGEMLYCRNRDLTVTNKILHYLLGGLAVVASNTTGQREVAEQAPGAVALYPSGNPEALATRLNELLGSPSALAQAKSAALHAAEQTFCWKLQEETLMKSVGRALQA
jgi:glycosyltransferase involved in cell wall biosynthesis